MIYKVNRALRQLEITAENEEDRDILTEINSGIQNINCDSGGYSLHLRSSGMQHGKVLDLNFEIDRLPQDKPYRE
jgi:hypothetical protein